MYKCHLTSKIGLTILITLIWSITICPAQPNRHPTPVGGWDKLQTAIQNQLPSRKDDVSGIIYVETTINKEGKMIDISVIKGIGGYADEDVESAVGKLNYPFHWAIVSGRPINNQLIFPVYYNLTPEQIADLKSEKSN